MPKFKLPTKEQENYISETFYLDNDEGHVKRAKDLGSRYKAGTIAGCIVRGPRTEYRVIGVPGSNGIMAHRIAYWLCYRDWAVGLDILHEDGDGLNNRIENLSAGTASKNQLNKRASGRIPYVGVSEDLRKNHRVNPYGAVYVGKYLGRFPTPEEAAAARELAAMKEEGKDYIKPPYFDEIKRYLPPEFQDVETDASSNHNSEDVLKLMASLAEMEQIKGNVKVQYEIRFTGEFNG